MATARKKPSAPKTKNTPSTKSAPAPSTNRTDPALIAALITRLASTPTAAQRAAWLTQYPLERTLVWAGKTVAAKTELEAFNWASAAAAVVSAPRVAGQPSPLKYTPARLTFLLECVQDLAAARSHDESPKTDASGARVARGAADSAATREFTLLNSALRGAAGRNDERRAEIREALASANPTSDTAARIGALAAVADRWSNGNDAPLALLCSEHDVALHAAAARAAAEHLRTSRGALAGAAATNRDTPEVNVAEARMLGEMAALRDALARARNTSGDPRYVLVKPSATAAIFVSGAADDEDSEPAPAPAPAPAK